MSNNMQFTIEELEMLRAALSAYESDNNCGDDDGYWQAIMALSRRIDYEIGQQAKPAQIWQGKCVAGGAYE